MSSTDASWRFSLDARRSSLAVPTAPPDPSCVQPWFTVQTYFPLVSSTTPLRPTVLSGCRRGGPSGPRSTGGVDGTDRPPRGVETRVFYLCDRKGPSLSRAPLPSVTAPIRPAGRSRVGDQFPGVRGPVPCGTPGGGKFGLGDVRIFRRKKTPSGTRAGGPLIDRRVRPPSAPVHVPKRINEENPEVSGFFSCSDVIYVRTKFSLGI